MRSDHPSALGIGTRAAICALATLSAAAELPARADLFGADEPLAVTLSAPFSAVFRDRDEREWQEAQLAYRDASGAEATVPLRVRVRGKSRAALCDFPPLLLNFRTSELKGTELEGEDRLKLVTHCESSGNYDQFLLLEYLSYRAWNLVSAASLRARLVNARYIDPAREREVDARPGILLEDEERFAERQGFTMFEGERIERARYDAESLALFDVFQYFLGNTDFSALAGPTGEQCCHNVVPYVRADGVLVPVPYDFDSAGLINAPHALPNERLPIKTVRQRLYRGACRTPEELAPALARFESQRAAILALFTEQSGLNPRTAAGARGYVEEFYAVLDDPKRREDAFFDVCAR